MWEKYLAEFLVFGVAGLILYFIAWLFYPYKKKEKAKEEKRFWDLELNDMFKHIFGGKAWKVGIVVIVVAWIVFLVSIFLTG